MGLLGLLFCLPASAENEATYTPDGVLYIPYVNVLDSQGQTVAYYAVTMQKVSEDWLFIIEGLTDLLIPETLAENTAAFFPNGRLYIPHATLLNSEGQTLRNYAVYLKKDSHWRFTLYGLTDLDATDNTSTNSSDTNTTTNVTADIAGDWDFSFTKSYNITNSGTEFGNTTEMTPYDPETISLTLEQTDEDVTGTGTADSVHYTLSGQVSGDLFSFSMLAGYTNQTIGLISAHVAVGDGTMGGDYYFARTNGVDAIEFGTVTAAQP